MEGNEMLRVLVFQEGGDWVAQCLEYDICTHAQRLNTTSACGNAANHLRGLNLRRRSIRPCGRRLMMGVSLKHPLVASS
jgi:hypothetical protein